MTKPDHPSISDTFNADALMELMAPSMDISIKPEWKPAVLSHLSTAAKMADIVYRANVKPDSINLSNVFVPGTKAKD